MTVREKVDAARARAYEVQAELEEALGFDADSEITGGMAFEDADGPSVIVTLTEAAAKRVLDLVKGRK